MADAPELGADRGGHRPSPECLVITGATGWLGQALLHAVAVEGGRHVGPSTVRVLVREKAEADVVLALAPTIEADVEIVAGDVAEPDDVARLFARLPAAVDVVHTAGVIHPRRVADFARINAMRHAQRGRGRLRAGVRRLVHVSSNSPFGTNADRSTRSAPTSRSTRTSATGARRWRPSSPCGRRSPTPRSTR